MNPAVLLVAAACSAAPAASATPKPTSSTSSTPPTEAVDRYGPVAPRTAVAASDPTHSSDKRGPVSNEAAVVLLPGLIYELEYRRAKTVGWIGTREGSEPQTARACVDSFPPLSTAVLRALDDCLDVAPTRDFIFEVSAVDEQLAITTREGCGATEAYLCDPDSAFFRCAGAVANVLPRSASRCWRPFVFATNP